MTTLTAKPASEGIAGFAALLRDHGMIVGPAEQTAMLFAIGALGGLKVGVVRSAWRAIACHSSRDWRQWDELFDRYWHPSRTRGQVKVSGQTRPKRDVRQAVQAMRDDMDAAASKPGSRAAKTAGDQPATQDAPVSDAPQAQGGASRAEALAQRDGQMWLPEELSQLRALAKQITNHLRPTPTRRWQALHNGRRLGLRQTLRRSVAFGGEPVNPVWLNRRVEAPKIFILVDVSRSMESHAAFFLRVARAFAQQSQARAFVFHTRIIEITNLLQRDSAAVQEKINAVTAGFGAGTRIATSLEAFTRQHARAQLSRSARVWVFSDGFDTDEPGALADALAELRQRGARLSWFNPTHKAAISAALQGGKKYIDRFVPLANLADLQAARPLLR